jgi:hypothetical protein
VPQRLTNDQGSGQPATSVVLALIRLEDLETMSQLAASHHDLDICTTADEFVSICANSQYEVAILPSGILLPNERILLKSYLMSLELRPSIILYSSTPTSLPWPGWLDAQDITVLMKPFTEAKLQDVISRAIKEFGERSKRRRC